jgi:alpha-N-arabinofuranosidase
LKRLSARFLLVLMAHPAANRQLHVHVEGNDANDGSAAKPYKTISAAAEVTQRGDVITLYEVAK